MAGREECKYFSRLRKVELLNRMFRLGRPGTPRCLREHGAAMTCGLCPFKGINKITAA